MPVSRGRPLVGIVGSAGAYGRWLRSFFETRMQLEVIGHDPVDAASASDAELVGRAEVLVFAVPIREAPQVIGHYVALAAAGRPRRSLWLDITSLKSAPVAAMLRSDADVVGLHPLTAPPLAPTLKGRALAVCRARLTRWGGWLDALLAALECTAVETTPDAHDRMMAQVQALVHAIHLVETSVWREQVPGSGALEALRPFGTALFEMDTLVATRILSLDAGTYEAIQFDNPWTRDVLRALAQQSGRLAALVEHGADSDRAAFRREFLRDNRAALDARGLAQGNRRFEQLSGMLADLDAPTTLGLQLVVDKPGSLGQVLRVFERHAINLASIHSTRTPGGGLLFRVGLDAATRRDRLRQAIVDLHRGKIARVVDQGDGA